MGGSTSSDEAHGVATSPRARATKTEPPLVTCDGRYTRVPSFCTSASDSGMSSTEMNMNETEENATREMEDLETKSKEELMREVMKLRRQINDWEDLTSRIVAAIALAPEMNSMYSRLLRTLLSEALKQITTIREILHIECSLPSITREKPKLKLLESESLSNSLWELRWSPKSWWISVSAIGLRWGLSFQALTTIRKIEISGKLRCAFSSDITAIRISFIEEPQLDMEIIADVGWGIVPLPVQQQIDQVVRAEMKKFLIDTLVGDNSTVFVLRRKIVSMTAEDLLEAKDAAKRANNIKFHSMK